MRTISSLALLLTLTSGIALVGCESHEHHHRADNYHDHSAIRGENTAAGITDNTHVNRSEGSSAGTAMTPAENRSSAEGPSANNGDTNTSPSANRSSGEGSVAPSTDNNPSKTTGSGGITDNTNVNRSEGPTTQPSQRSASDQ